MQAHPFTRSATVKSLSCGVGRIVLSYSATGAQDGFDGYVEHRNGDEREAILDSSHQDLLERGFLLLHTHHQWIGQDIQTVRFYVEVA